MKITKNGADTVIIVPAEYKDQVDRWINVIREKDEPKRLENDCENLKEALAHEFGRESGRDALVCGRNYGVIVYSPMATAIRNGNSIPYHGEIYLCVWTYCEDGMFRTTNAWGVTTERRLPGSPIIEL